MVFKCPSKFPSQILPLISRARKYPNKELFFKETEGRSFGNIKVDEYGFITYKKRIPVRDLILRESMQDILKIKEYALRSEYTMPPIIVRGTGKPNTKYTVIDGHHRVLAAKQRGTKMIDTWVQLVNDKNKPILLIDIYYSRNDLCEED